MICFLVARGFDFTLTPLLSDPCAPHVTALAYDEALPKCTLAKATYVFTDLDRLSVNELTGAARLYRRLRESGCRVLNDPATARKRFALLRGLYLKGSNPFNIHLADEGHSDFKFPVFIRVADGHDGPLSKLIADRTELETAIEAASVAGIPLSAIAIVEYAAEPIRPGVYRKGSIQRVGQELITMINWHGGDWLVEGDQYALTDQALYDEELSMVRENQHASEASEIFEFANIEYGRMDFGLVEGRLCVYEINTNPTIIAPGPHSVPQRMESSQLRWSRFLDALHAIDTDEDAAEIEVEVEGSSIEAWNRASKLYPALRVPRRRLGQERHRLSKEYEQRGDLGLALHHAEEAVAANPRGPLESSRLASVLNTQGRTEQAVAVARQAMALSPRVPQRVLLAEILMTTGHNAEARDCAQKAVALSPEEWEPHLLLSEALWRLGAGEQAHPPARRAAELSSGTLRAHIWRTTLSQRLGAKHLRAGCYAQARERLQEAFSGHLQLGAAYLKRGDFRRALRAAVRATMMKAMHLLARLRSR